MKVRNDLMKELGELKERRQLELPTYIKDPLLGHPFCFINTLHLCDYKAVELEESDFDKAIQLFKRYKTGDSRTGSVNAYECQKKEFIEGKCDIKSTEFVKYLRRHLGQDRRRSTSKKYQAIERDIEKLFPKVELAKELEEKIKIFFDRIYAEKLLQESVKRVREMDLKNDLMPLVQQIKEGN